MEKTDIMKKEEENRMIKDIKTGVTITLLLGMTVASVIVGISSTNKVFKLEQEIVTLEEKLANTESANEVLVEQLKQLIGGR